VDDGSFLGNDHVFSLVGTSRVVGKETSFNVFLSIVPSTTSVGERESNLDTRDDVTSQKSGNKGVGEKDTTEEGSKDDDSTRGDHVLEGGVSGDRDASLVIGLLLTTLDKRNLSSNLTNHGLSGVTDSRHGKSGESVWEHSTDEETGESEGLKDVDGGGVAMVSNSVRSKVGLDTGNVSTEEGKSDEGSGTNGETLTNSGGSVTSGIKGISSLADILMKVAHLSNTTSIIRDRTVTINSEGNRKAAKHTDGRQSNTVHSSPVESEHDGDSEADNGDDGGHVTEGETLDDVGGGIVGASTSELAGGAIGVGGVVLSGETNQKTGPETKHDATVSSPWGCIVCVVSELDHEVFGEDVNNTNEHSGHQNGGDDKLHLELELNGTVIDVSEEGGDERSTNTNGSNNHGEVSSISGHKNFDGGAGNNKSGAGGLSKGTEKISTHTSNITNIVTDVVSNGTRVKRRVLGKLLTNLTSEVSTNISGLGIDTTTNSTEEGNSGATETVSGNVFEKLSNIVLPVTNHVAFVGTKDGGFVGKDDDFENEESKTNEGEAEDLTTAESVLETFVNINVATVSGLNIGGGSDHHTDVTSSH